MRIVADHVKSFQMISKEYFEVGVVGVVMESCVYVVVVCACIRGIFHFEVFYEDEVFDDLDSLDLTVSTEKVTDCGVVCVLHS